MDPKPASQHLELVREKNLTGQITRSGRHPIATGGYSSVWLGEWRPEGEDWTLRVAIKTLRGVDVGGDITRPERINKRLKREMNVWSTLDHENIVPFLGFTAEEEGGLLFASLIAPWYPNGNVLNYLPNHPDADRNALCEDVARGMRYLHENQPPIVHGDIKAANVLIGDGRASICDFGLAVALDDVSSGFTSSVMGGTTRFLAPELLEDDARTTRSDVYAYACVCLEILFDEQPYKNISSEGAVINAIARKKPPREFSDADLVSSPLPALLQKCWAFEPLHRPAMRDVCDVFVSLKQGLPVDASRTHASQVKSTNEEVANIKASVLAPTFQIMHKDLFPAVTQFLRSKEEVKFIQQEAYHTRNAMPVPVPEAQKAAFQKELEWAMRLVYILEPGLIMYNALLPPHQAPLFEKAVKSIHLLKEEKSVFDSYAHTILTLDQVRDVRDVVKTHLQKYRQLQRAGLSSAPLRSPELERARVNKLTTVLSRSRSSTLEGIRGYTGVPLAHVMLTSFNGQSEPSPLVAT